ncbi:hypothetical protein [Methanobacterium sp.]|uniref:hypothetical protein n=1 Tax=Methanobacterium sp. TaxID=2164 RepID=UPI003C7663BA
MNHSYGVHHGETRYYFETSKKMKFFVASKLKILTALKNLSIFGVEGNFKFPEQRNRRFHMPKHNVFETVRNL